MNNFDRIPLLTPVKPTRPGMDRRPTRKLPRDKNPRRRAPESRRKHDDGEQTPQIDEYA